MLSLVIPCYNCGSYIDSTVGQMLAFLSGKFPKFEIILVDDGSSDDTPERLRAWHARDPRVSAYALTSNQGKGAAVKAGVLNSRGEYIIFTDADLPYQLEALVEFVQALKSGNDLVLGSRYIAKGDSVAGQTGQRTLLSRVFAALANMVLRERVPDTQAGIKGFTRQAALVIFNHLTIFRFCFDVEVIAIAQQERMRIVSLPVRLVHQSESSVRPVRDGLRMCADLARIFIRYRLS